MILAERVYTNTLNFKYSRLWVGIVINKRQLDPAIY